MTCVSSSMDKTVEALVQGRAALYPTETVYGVGVAVRYAADPSIIYDIKHREYRKPIAWLVGDLKDLDVYGKHVPEFARVLARTFWPGPLTLIVNASDKVPQAFQSPAATIGLRMPNNDTALQLIAHVGCPLATSSANVSGNKAQCSFDLVDDAIKSSVGACLADVSDTAKSGVASTVVDCTGDHPVMVRTGAITISDIQALS